MWRYDNREYTGGHGSVVLIRDATSGQEACRAWFAFRDPEPLLEEVPTWLQERTRHIMEQAFAKSCAHALFYGQLGREVYHLLGSSVTRPGVGIEVHPERGSALKYEVSAVISDGYEAELSEVVQREILLALRTACITGLSQSRLEDKTRLDPDLVHDRLRRLIGEQLVSEFHEHDTDRFCYRITPKGERRLARLPSTSPTHSSGIEPADRTRAGRPSRRCFLCYSSQDSRRVKSIARSLDTLGVDIWFAEWRLRVGDSLHSRIAEAIDSSGWLVVFLSSASVASAWVKKELNAALVRELSDQQFRVLPALLESCVLPTFLRDKVYADFRQGDDAGLRELATVLKEGNTKTEPPKKSPRAVRPDQGQRMPYMFCPKCGSSTLRWGEDLDVDTDRGGLQSPTWIPTIYCTNCKWETRETW